VLVAEMAQHPCIVVERLDQQSVNQARAGSPDALAFNDPVILDALCEQVEWWGACLGSDILIAWPACRPYGRDVRPPYLSYFVGPLRSAKLCALPTHRRVILASHALESLATVICSRYGAIKASFPPGFDDIRALNWWQTGAPGRRLVVTPRWTARIGPLSMDAEPKLYEGIARNRRRDIAAVERSPPLQTDKLDAAEVTELYTEPFIRQGTVPEPEREISLSRTLTLLEAGSGELIGWRDTIRGNLISVLLVVDGPIDANNVLCVATAERRERGLTAWTTWQGLLRAAQRGKRWFDFNGANSPARAADKHHFGAAPVLYFDVELGAE